ncbi:hypothetical protein GCM10009830_29670 [Glycomyces endophyticus]|uniref:FHA domain-containing protein n=1 Tax=Glycomyces endophyticus TaxID=480996 RepID=A0ABP4T1A2_9ACTN
MTVTCPSCAHESADTEWCDNCGRPLTGGDPALPLHATGPILPPPRCPACAERQLGRFCQACGYDFAGDAGPTPISGHTTLAPDAAPALDADADRDPADAGQDPDRDPAARDQAAPDPDPARPQDPAPPAPDSGFEVLVSADREFYDRLAAHPGGDSLPFPPYAPDRRIPLRGDHVRIGRGSRDGGDRPEVDLSSPPADIGVSHLHAVLMRTSDGWSIVDLGSYNGTRLGGRRLEANVPVPLPEGTVLHLGAWTAIRLRRTGKDDQR